MVDDVNVNGTGDDPGQSERAKRKAEKTKRKAEKAKRKAEEKKWTVPFTIIGVILTLASVIAASASARYSRDQTNVASQQNRTVDRQQLLALAIDISKQPAQPLPVSASVAAENELLADGQAAEQIIDMLHKKGVTGIEYVEVARALESGGDDGQAIRYFIDAAAIAQDPATFGDALRNEANVRYRLREPDLGHQVEMSAVSGYENWKQAIPPVNRDLGIALTYLEDAQNQLGFSGCVLAKQDMSNAERTLAPFGRRVETLQIKDLTKSDKNTLKSITHSKGCANSKQR